MKNFVSTKWLQNHLDDENIVIVDCRGDLLRIAMEKKFIERDI